MSVTQSQFTAAMLDPDRAVPPGLTDARGRPAGRRFSVYRNNVAVSLTEALETAFPVIRQLVGAEFFGAMAGVYLRSHPPRTPMMMYYGAEMPEFLAGFDPVRYLPYLPDVARLELALRHSYHAADAKPIDPSSLQRLTPEQLLAARFEFVPALRLVHSNWPIVGIWMQNARQGPKPAARAETALIARPKFDPVVSFLPATAGRFVTALMQGQGLENAMTTAGEGLDLQATLAALIGNQTISRIN